MALVRTNITIPEETLALIDAVAGPRGRSAYISDVLARSARRDNARRIFRETAGVLKGNSAWGATQEEVDANLRAARDSWDRDESIWPEGRGGDDVPA
jgi:hypothetical protein